MKWRVLIIALLLVAVYIAGVHDAPFWNAIAYAYRSMKQARKRSDSSGMDGPTIEGIEYAVHTEGRNPPYTQGDDGPTQENLGQGGEQVAT